MEQNPLSDLSKTLEQQLLIKTIKELTSELQKTNARLDAIEELLKNKKSDKTYIKS